MADTGHCEQKGNGLSIPRKLIKAWSLALVQILYHMHILLVSVGDAQSKVYVRLFCYLNDLSQLDTSASGIYFYFWLLLLFIYIL